MSIARSTTPANLAIATNFALWAEQNLTTFIDSIAAQIDHARPSEQNRILELTYASLRARQELRGVLR